MNIRLRLYSNILNANQRSFYLCYMSNILTIFFLLSWFQPKKLAAGGGSIVKGFVGVFLLTNNIPLP